MKINWGSGIAIFYTLFVIAMVTMVIKSSQNKTHMVQENYYEKDINYEDFRQKRENGNLLNDLVKINYINSNRNLTISLPSNPNDIKGDVTLYRPSNQYLDKKYQLKLDDQGVMTIPLERTMANGRWKVQVSWKNKDSEFFNEKEIFI